MGGAVGVITAAASVYGALKGSSAAKKAASAQSGAAKKGIALEREALEKQLEFQREALAQEKTMFDKSLELGTPYRNAGERALQQYENLLYGRQAPDMEKFAIAPVFNQVGYDQALSDFNLELLSSLSAKKYSALPESRKNFYEPAGKNYALKDRIEPKKEDFFGPKTYDETGYQSALDAYNELQTPDGQALEKERMGALIKTPGYQFQFDEGTKALERSAAARSGLLSGAQSKAMTRFGQGLASTYFQSFMDRLAGITGQGASVSGAGANAAMQSGAQQSGILSNMGAATRDSASNVGSLLSQAGAAKASGYIGQAGALNQGFNNIAGVLGAQGKFGGGYGNYGNLGRIDWY